MLEGIVYDIKKVNQTSQIVLARIGQVPLLSPTSNCVIFYAKLCGVPNLLVKNDIDELWWRISYLRALGFSVYQTDNGATHPMEPFYADVEAHLGLTIETPHIPRKQWLNQKIDLFIEYNNLKSNNASLKFATAEFLAQREPYIVSFIEQETKIDVKSLGNQTQQPNANPTEKKPEVNVPTPENLSGRPEPPKNTPEWWAWKGMNDLLAKDKTQAPQPQAEKKVEPVVTPNADPNQSALDRQIEELKKIAMDKDAVAKALAERQRLDEEAKKEKIIESTVVETEKTPLKTAPLTHIAPIRGIKEAELAQTSFSRFRGDKVQSEEKAKFEENLKKKFKIKK